MSSGGIDPRIAGGVPISVGFPERAAPSMPGVISPRISSPDAASARGAQQLPAGGANPATRPSDADLSQLHKDLTALKNSKPSWFDKAEAWLTGTAMVGGKLMDEAAIKTASDAYPSQKAALYQKFADNHGQYYAQVAGGAKEAIRKDLSDAQIYAKHEITQAANLFDKIDTIGKHSQSKGEPLNKGSITIFADVMKEEMASIKKAVDNGQHVDKSRIDRFAQNLRQLDENFRTYAPVTARNFEAQKYAEAVKSCNTALLNFTGPPYPPDITQAMLTVSGAIQRSDSQGDFTLKELCDFKAAFQKLEKFCKDQNNPALPPPIQPQFGTQSPAPPRSAPDPQSVAPRSGPRVSQPLTPQHFPAGVYGGARLQPSGPTPPASSAERNPQPPGSVPLASRVAQTPSTPPQQFPAGVYGGARLQPSEQPPIDAAPIDRSSERNAPPSGQQPAVVEEESEPAPTPLPSQQPAVVEEESEPPPPPPPDA